MKKLPFEVHPAANIFPMMKGAAFTELVEDIRKHGIKEPIVFWKGQLLDGRNRATALMEIGLDPSNHACDIEDKEGFDPLEFVLSANLHRRHLGETERETIAAKIANLEQGGDRKSEEIKPTNGGLISTADAAEQLNVNPRNVERAKAAIKGGCKKLVEMLQAGEIKSSTAEKFVKAIPDKKDQAEILKGGLEAVRQAIKESKQAPQNISTKVDTKTDTPPQEETPAEEAKPQPKAKRQFFNEARKLFDEMDDFHRQKTLDLWSEWLLSCK